MQLTGPAVRLLETFVQMLEGIYVVCAPGFLFAEQAKSSGGSIVMLPLHVHVLLLVFIEQECRYTIVRLLVITETLVWIAVSFLQHLLCFLDVNGWSPLSFLHSSPNIHT